MSEIEAPQDALGLTVAAKAGALFPEAFEARLGQFAAPVVTVAPAPAVIVPLMPVTAAVPTFLRPWVTVNGSPRSKYLSPSPPGVTVRVPALRTPPVVELGPALETTSAKS